MTGFLSPYRVLDLTDERALLTGQVLADLGADVIQVEPPGGSPARSDPHWWAAYARNKRGIVCDVDARAGRDRIRALAATADFLIECERPGVLASKGLGYDELAAVNPALVYVSVTPFGQDGCKAHWAAEDLTLWAAGGPLLLTGDADRPPVAFAVPQAYLHGAAEAAVGALVAHAERVRSGRGQHVDVSVQQAVAQATLSQVLAAAVGAPDAARRAPGAMRFRWQVADGWLEMTPAIGPTMRHFTNNLLHWMFEEGACDETVRDIDFRTALDDIAAGMLKLEDLQAAFVPVESFLAARTKRDLLEAALARKLMLAPVATIEDIVASPHTIDRGYVAAVEGDEQPMYPGPFAKIDTQPIRYVRHAPTLGEHDGEVGERTAPAYSPGPDGQPFEGLRVLDLSWIVAGPTVARVLAEHGATVVRVETSGHIDTTRVIGPFHGGATGIENSALYGNVNAGKLGTALDLDIAEAREVVRDLVLWADVVTESFTPGVMTRWGFDDGALRALNPAVVVLRTCLMGQTGPYRALAGFGNIGAAMAGFQNVVGWPDRPPAGPFGPYTDFIAPRFSLAALIAALDHRARTGEGCVIEQSQAESAMHFLAPAFVRWLRDGEPTERSGNAHPVLRPHGVYPCLEDQWVAIAVRTDEQRSRLEAIAGGPIEPDDALAAWTVTRAAPDVESLMQDARIAAHVVASSSSALEDAQLVHRKHFVELEHPIHGRTTVEGSRFTLSRTPAVFSRCAPTYGRDDDYVLREILGYDDERIAALAESGALA